MAAKTAATATQTRSTSSAVMAERAGASRSRGRCAPRSGSHVGYPSSVVVEQVHRRIVHPDADAALVHLNDELRTRQGQPVEGTSGVKMCQLCPSSDAEGGASRARAAASRSSGRPTPVDVRSTRRGEAAARGRRERRRRRGWISAGEMDLGLAVGALVSPWKRCRSISRSSSPDHPRWRPLDRRDVLVGVEAEHDEVAEAPRSAVRATGFRSRAPILDDPQVAAAASSYNPSMSTGSPAKCTGRSASCGV